LGNPPTADSQLAVGHVAPDGVARFDAGNNLGRSAKCSGEGHFLALSVPDPSLRLPVGEAVLEEVLLLHG
jgi:hypothetical protein